VAVGAHLVALTHFLDKRVLTERSFTDDDDA
jgi:hypothetical protein